MTSVARVVVKICPPTLSVTQSPPSTLGVGVGGGGVGVSLVPTWPGGLTPGAGGLGNRKSSPSDTYKMSSSL